MRIDAYIRVSKVAGREGERFISPGEQRKACSGWAGLNGHEVVSWHEDLDQPGTKRDRPGLAEVMGRVESGDVEGIVVAKLDRFGRSVPHLAELVERLQAVDAALFTVAEGIDSRGATGRMLLTILSAIAEFDLSRIRDNWAAARENAIGRGVFVGGAVPIGYRRLEDGRLEPDQWADTVRAVFSRRAGGESWASLARWLSSELGEDRSVGTVRHMIGNRAYLGEVTGGGALLNRKAHKALVDRATFEAASATRGVSPPRSGNASGVLSGILRCASCRYAMKPSMNAHGLEYRCKGGKRENASVCPEPASVSASQIEPLVISRFLDQADAQWLGHEGGDVEGVERELLEAEGELAASLDTRLVDALGGDSDAYIALVRKRRSAVDAVKARLATERGKTIALPDAKLRELWPDLDLAERRHLVAAALDCVFVRRGSDVVARTHFCWRGDAPELPTRGRRWAPQPFHFPVEAGPPLH